MKAVKPKSDSKTALSQRVILLLFTAQVLFSPQAALWSQNPQAALVENPGFEEGAPGSSPPGWLLSEPAKGVEFEAEESTGAASEGTRSARIRRRGPAGDRSTLYQEKDATGLRGRRLKLGTAMRAMETSDGWLRPFLEIYRPGKDPRTLVGEAASSTWKVDELYLDVSTDAVRIRFGFMASGDVSGWVDAVSLLDVGPAGEGNEAPSPLSAKGEANLLAYLHLLGAVRYFHPSDQAASLDWDRFVIVTLGEVERAESPVDLQKTFSRLFHPIAPTVRFFRTGEALPRAALPRPPGARVISWRHYGLETGAARSRYHFRSRRVGGLLPEASGEVSRDLSKNIRPGARLRLSFEGRTGRKKDRGEVRFRALDKKGQVLTEARQRLAGPKWQRYNMEIQIPPSTAVVSCSLSVSGSSKGSLDDVSFEEVGTTPRQILEADNFDLDLRGEVPEGWVEPLESRAAGFRAEADTVHPFRGRASLLLHRIDNHGLPTPRGSAVLDLGGGISALVPVALYSDRHGTLPHQEETANFFVEKKPTGFEPSGDDRATRLADILLLGAALENFYPYADVRPTLSADFGKALEEAAEDSDERHFLDTLRRLTHALNDGHAEATHSVDPRRFRMPLLWTSIGDSLVLMWVAPEIPDVRPGDIVIEIDGKKIAEAITGAESLVSGASASHRRFRALELLASGNKGEERELRLQRGEGQPFTVKLSCSSPAFGAKLGSRLEAFAEVAPDIFYLDLDRADSDRFLNALPQLAKAKGIIFDLRGYPRNISTPLVLGRLLERPESVSAGVEVRTRPDRSESLDVLRYFVKPQGQRLTAKIVFLTDERAVSLAEAVLQLVAEHGLASIIGTPTAGTQGEIDEMVLPGAYHVLWTGTRALRADGTPFRGLGVVPSILAKPSLAGITAERDEVLDVAVSYLKDKPGLPH